MRKRSVTDKPAPRACYKELDPWLKLANMTKPKALATMPEDVAHEFFESALSIFPDTALSPEVEREARRIFGRKGEPLVFFLGVHFTRAKTMQLYDLAHAARETFEALIRARQEREAKGKKKDSYPSLTTGAYQSLRTAAYRREFQVTSQGRLEPRDDLFHGGLIRTLIERAEVGRFERCEICQAFMYSVRRGQKACSKRCNSVRRARKFRQRQAMYEYNRKLSGAGLAKEKN